MFQSVFFRRVFMLLAVAAFIAIVLFGMKLALNWADSMKAVVESIP